MQSPLDFFRASSCALLLALCMAIPCAYATAPSPNNIVEPGEACDGTNLNGLTCASVAPGFIGGVLTCKEDRSGYDVSKCTPGGVVSAATCNATDVQAAIDKAVDGDTVLVPEGTCTWTSSVRIDSYVLATNKKRNRSLILKGAGVDKTTIVENLTSNGSALGGSTQLGKPVRITGFTFDGSKTKDNYASVSLSGPPGQALFRVDHCKFVNVTERGIIAATVYGVIDHNTFVRIPFKTYAATLISVIGDLDASWSRPQDQGTTNAVYMEDNVFIHNIQANGPFDMYDGARYVFRHNEVHGNGLGHHGFDSGSHGIVNFEVYNNTFTNSVTLDSPYFKYAAVVTKSDFAAADATNGASVLSALLGKGVLEDVSGVGVRLKSPGITRPTELTGIKYNRIWSNLNGLFTHGIVFEMRSGSGVIFNNVVSRPSAASGDTGSYDLFLLLRNYRSSDGYLLNYGGVFPWDGKHPFNGVCDGTNPLDGNLPGMLGYPCKDQIGRTSGIGPDGKQTLSPVYSWNNNFLGKLTGNLHVGGYVAPPPGGMERVTIHIVEGRDYYNDVAKPGYVPYVYPHPLVQVDIPRGDSPKAPTLLRLDR